MLMPILYNLCCLCTMDYKGYKCSRLVARVHANCPKNWTSEGLDFGRPVFGHLLYVFTFCGKSCHITCLDWSYNSNCLFFNLFQFVLKKQSTKIWLDPKQILQWMSEFQTGSVFGPLGCVQSLVIQNSDSCPNSECKMSKSKLVQ